MKIKIIISIETISMNDDDIILVKLYLCNEGMSYREVNIRGKNMQITSEVIRKVSDMDK